MPPSNLLTTVSRIVSNAADSFSAMPNNPDVPKITPKRKPKPLHVALWLHIFTLFILIPLGFIDVIPGSGPVSSNFSLKHNVVFFLI